MLRPAVHKIIFLAAIFISAVFFVKYGAKSTVFYGDALGYYMYLPATFIYHNTDMMYELPQDKGIDWGIQWYAGIMKQNKSKTGKEINQYTYGIALMEMPFFFIAHIIEMARGPNATGYTATYQNLIKISSVFYALLGLMLLFRVLKRYFPTPISFLTIISLFIGTNLFWFTLKQAGMSHVPLFFLYTLLIYLTIQLHDKPTKITFILMGLTTGLITIIRPTDILCALIPLLYNVYNKETMRAKIVFLKENISGLLLLVVSFIIVIAPQLLYWHATTGQYIFYSYGDQTFHWRHPKIKEGLFYFSNGWLPYCPIMIFSLAGFLLYRRFTGFALSAWIITPVYIYIIYSWYCYNYINGLGSRPMIHLYPLLAIPLAVFFQFIAEKKMLAKIAVTTLSLFFIGLNLGFSRLKAAGLLNSEESNMAYNFQVFFSRQLTYNDQVVFDVGQTQPSDDKVTKIATLACNNFDDSVSGRYIRDTVFNSRYFYELKDDEHSPGIAVAYNKKLFKGAKWFRCSGKFMYTQNTDYYKHLLLLEVQDKLWRACKIDNKINRKRKYYRYDYNKINTWGEVSFYVRIPCKLTDGDTIRLHVWNTAKTDLFMDDLCLELCK